jgi:hypothetical protein
MTDLLTLSNFDPEALAAMSGVFFLCVVLVALAIGALDD